MASPFLPVLAFAVDCSWCVSEELTTLSWVPSPACPAGLISWGPAWAAVSWVRALSPAGLLVPLEGPTGQPRPCARCPATALSWSRGRVQPLRSHCFQGALLNTSMAL